jgi:hypothetical protein
MGRAIAADINRRVVYLLQDSGLNTGAVSQSGSADGPPVASQSNLRWSVDELLLWITDAQRAIVQLRPHSNNIVAVVPLVAGPRQRIPIDGWLLLTVNSNMAGSVYGRAVTLATFDQLNRQLPGWRGDKMNPVAYNYLFDSTDQKAFYVWPPNDGTGGVELNYSATPPLVNQLTDSISLDDIFVPPIVDYVCARAALKDSEFGPGLQFSTNFMQSFMVTLTGKDAGEKSQNPDAALPPMSNR